MVEFYFNEDQRKKAAAEAYRRQRTNEATGRKGRNRGSAVGPAALQKHMIGAAGELAVAAFLGIEQYAFRDLVPIRGSSDLPGKIDVKTRPCHGWDLLVQLDDDPDKTYVLVTIQNKRTFIHGWIHGSSMRPEWIKEHVPGRPCYSVPQDQLLPIEGLRCQPEAA